MPPHVLNLTGGHGHKEKNDFRNIRNLFWKTIERGYTNDQCRFELQYSVVGAAEGGIGLTEVE